MAKLKFKSPPRQNGHTWGHSIKLGSYRRAIVVEKKKNYERTSKLLSFCVTRP